MNLTEQQQKAAYALNSVVVTAGAGTGKTAMLAERFLFHVQEQCLRPIEIVAVTFTEKAAAEFRQRIRNRLVECLDDEEVIAEVDAAQISTIHALAARVCREFYHLVEIPPDFRILMETDSDIWLADKFDDAMSKVDETIIAELGYDWLKGAMRLFLQDPPQAMKAFEHDAESWKNTIDKERNRSLEWLRNCDAWRSASDACMTFSGKEGDNLESARQNAIRAMTDLESDENVPAAIATLRRMQAHQGQKGNWAAGEIDQMRTALKALKTAAAQEGPAWAATLYFGTEDSVAAEKVKLLHKAFVAVHEHLLKQKKHDKVLDFIDLEIFARQILEHEQVRKHYAKRWRAFLVDEFQDTNPLQAEIIDLLRGDARLTVVGDEKQSIYGFRRADVQVFRNFRESVAGSGGEAVPLSETFRSHETLAVAVNETFAPVLGELHQALHANRKESPNREIPVSLAIVADDKAPPDRARIVESKYIASEIERMLSTGVQIFDRHAKELRAIECRDIAVLSRTWAAVDVYIDALSAIGIPAVNAGGGNLMATREAKDAIAILSFLADPTDDISLAAVLRSPFFAISDLTLFRLASAKQKEQTWWNVIQDADAEIDRARETLANLLAVKDQLLPEELLRRTDAVTGYTATIANLPQGDRRQADWMGVLSLFRELAANGRSDLVGAVRQARALTQGRANIPRPPLDAGNAVTLSSIHNAKGLEWPVVIVPDLTAQAGGYSDRLVIEGDLGVAFDVEDESSTKAKPAIYEVIKRAKQIRERDEDKRLLYVAVTRARDGVVLTSSGPAKKGTMLELLMPGIEAANIPVTPIPYAPDLAIPAAPMEPPLFPVPNFSYTASLDQGMRTIPVTGLTDYAVCPLKFHYIYVEGHPGLGEGSSRRRAVGTLTHKALELGITNVKALEQVADGHPAEYVEEALKLASVFRSNAAFALFRDPGFQKEKAVSFKFGGAVLHGVADLVGDDFVLDYKTGDDSNGSEYRFQLWAYAKALAKPKAYVAFLRNQRLHQFSADAIRDTEKAATQLISNIVAGNFIADPSPTKCTKCVYSSICPSSAAKLSARATATQLRLFE